MNKELLKPYKEKAELLGIKNPDYLMQIANGHRNASPVLAQKIHELTGMPLWEILPDVYPKALFESVNSISE